MMMFLVPPILLIVISIVDMVRISLFSRTVTKAIDDAFESNMRSIRDANYSMYTQSAYPDVHKSYSNLGFMQIWKWNFKSYIVF